MADLILPQDLVDSNHSRFLFAQGATIRRRPVPVCGGRSNKITVRVVKSGKVFEQSFIVDDGEGPGGEKFERGMRDKVALIFYDLYWDGASYV